MPVDYGVCSEALEAAFTYAEGAFLEDRHENTQGATVNEDLDTVFASGTQAFREVLVGCVLALISDQSIDITKPYASQGDDAFNGRSLDQQVVNPALKQRRIPSSGGPYLNVFRRSVEFVPATRSGVLHKGAYDAFLRILDYVASECEGLTSLLEEVAYRFVLLREKSNVPLNRIQRMSLEQISHLVTLLLETPSGGRLPMFIVIATLQAIKATFDLDWEIDWRDINVADSASGLGGDIEVTRDGQQLLVAEVTERRVDQTRIVTTFNNKIGPNALDDYFFFVGAEVNDAETLGRVRQYFAQGHEINFLVVAEWVQALLATIGTQGRRHFINNLIVLLQGDTVPAALRAAWNSSVDEVISS